MAINLDVHGNTQPLEAAVQSAINRIRRQPIKISVDDKGATQPLGNMKRAADEFSKSMEAANARIIAFGASMAIINGVADAFKGMVKNMVEVEKALADINVVMGLSARNLDDFSDGLFKVAKETGAAFKIAADAATEYARQGLNVEESLKRTKDALILTRLTGMDSAEAVKSLTAAMNTYGSEIKDTTQLVSKFAAVDVKFAVSAEDFADAIARTGAAAKGAGVDIDELIGLVTAAQQQTARGGKVIGNSFKTIFTRIGRTDTLNQLENLGIAVRDIEGKTLGAKRILTDLANTFDHLSEAQKAQIAQTVGGVFQINVLKAVLGDAAKQNGILANATQISAGATTEAIDKNEQLRQTMAAMATETGLAIKEVSAQIGEIMLAPGIEKILSIVKSGAEGLSGLLGDGEDSGSKFASGFLKGMGNVISGPGLVVMTAVFGKLFLKAASFAKESLTSLIGVTSEAQKQKAIQTSLVGLFGRSSELSKEMLRTDISRTEKEKIILGLLKMQVSEAKALDSIAKSTASTLYSKGFGANLAPRRGRAYGHIPNFANPEREQAARGGYAAGSIRSMNMPGEGSVIYNSAEKVKTFSGLNQPAIMPPLSSKAGKNYQQAFVGMHGFDPYAAKGFVPNFNKASLKFVNRRALKNINLSKHAKKLAILFGYGGEGIQNNSYSQSFTSMGSGKYSNTLGHNASANSALTRHISRKYPNIMKSHGNSLEKLHASLYAQNPNVSVTLPSKAIMPVSSSDVASAKKMDELGDQKLKGIVRPPLDSAMKSIAQGIGHTFLVGAGAGVNDKISSIFTENSKGTKANDIIGALAEMGVRGALSAVAEKTGSGDGGQAGAAFDFTGGHAKKISEFFGKGYAFDAVEMKLRGSTAAGSSGGIPKKVINRLMAASGYIPNFANPLSDAIGRERDAGVPVSQIRVGAHPALMNKGNPIGLGVTNTRDEPNGLKDVFGAKGYVPNYAVTDFILGKKNPRVKALDVEISALTKSIDKYQKQIDSNTLSKRQSNEITRRLNNAESKLSTTVEKRDKALERDGQRQGGLVGKYGAANKWFERSTAGRMFGSTGGQMALMMGLPMAGGFIQGEDKTNKTRMGLGGALQGAGTGAAMGMMFGPLGAAIGAAAGGLMGFFSATNEATEALKEKTRQENQVLQQQARVASQLFAEGIDPRDKLSETDIDKQSYFYREYKDKLGGLTVGEALETFSAGDMFNKEGLAETNAQSDNLDKIKKATGMGREDMRRHKDTLVKFQKQLLMTGFRGREDESFTDPDLLKAFGFEGKTSVKGKEIRTKVSRLRAEEMGSDDYKELHAMMSNVAKLVIARGKEEEKVTAGVILQLNFQKAILAAQQKAKMDQLEIQATYAKQNQTLKLEQKIIGSSITERQKAMYRYTEAINKAAEAFQKGTKRINSEMKIGLISQIKGDKSLSSVFKTRLADKGSDLTTQELTSKLEGMSANQIIDTLKRIKKAEQSEGVNTSYIDELLENILQKRKDGLAVLEKTRDSSKDLAESEKGVNLILAERKQSLADMQRINEMNSRALQSIQKIRGFDNQVGAAQRALDFGPGYKTQQEREAFSLREQQFALEEKIKRLRENERNEIDKLEARPEVLAQKQFLEYEDRIKKYWSSYQKGEGLDESLKMSSEELTVYKGLKDQETERLKTLEDIEQKKKILNDETKKEISASQQLLEKERERLAIARAHKTGPGAFGNAFRDVGKKMLEDAETLDYQLGTITANHFRDGMVGAMEAALDRSKDLGDALNGIAIGFLSAIRNAMLTAMANQVVGAMGFSQGGRVPARVSNGEYLMSRGAVNKYGGSFMHSLNAGGKIPGYSLGGKRRSKIAGYDVVSDGVNERVDSGRRYRQMPMSGFFYSQADSPALEDDVAAYGAVTQARKAAEQRRLEKKAKKRALIANILSTVATAFVSSAVSGMGKSGSNVAKTGAKMTDAFGNPTTDGAFMGYGADAPANVRSGIDRYGNQISVLPDGFFRGGKINKYASGGYISGKSGIDQIPAMLSEGEYVIRASSARQLGKPLLDKINAGRFYDGGETSPLSEKSESSTSGGNTNNINISVNLSGGSNKEDSEEKSDGQQKGMAEDKMKLLSQQIKKEVVAVIVQEQRPGGLLQDTK